MFDFGGLSLMTVCVIVLDAAVPYGAGWDWQNPGPTVKIVSADPLDLAEEARRVDADHLIVLARTAELDRARFATTVASGSLPGQPIALLHASASAVGLACAAAAALAVTTDPGKLPRLIARLLAEQRSGAWLRGVGGLSHPSPSVAQHLRSLLPGGAGYLVTFGPEPSIRKASVPLTPEAGPVFVGAERSSAAYATTLAALGSEDGIPVSPVCSPKDAYGSEGAEFVILPEVPVLDAPDHDCPVCGLGIDGPACPYCHVQPRVKELAE